MNINLFHGSNVAISEIDLSKGLIDKDFGQGFYLTDILDQAQAMANRRVRITQKGHPVVSTFEFDDAFLYNSELNVKLFDDSPTEEWALFVMSNRNSSQTGFTHPYDIVVGPVANDGVAFQMERYEEGLIDLPTLVRELTFRKLNRQYYFGTERAIATLKKI